MSDRSAIKRVFGTALATLLSCALLLPAAQATEVPYYIEYTGHGFDVERPTGNPFDLAPPNLVDADAKGSFGAKSAVIMSNFVLQFQDAPVPPCEHAAQAYYLIGYANAVTSFKDGSQLYARGEWSDNGWMCIDVNTGEFFGESYGKIVGGTGRFEGASGTYTSPFSGKQLIFPFVGTEHFPFGTEYPLFAITGSFYGTVEFD